MSIYPALSPLGGVRRLPGPNPVSTPGLEETGGQSRFDLTFFWVTEVPDFRTCEGRDYSLHVSK